jgi:sec-independent protein translocase protein TatC
MAASAVILRITTIVVLLLLGALLTWGMRIGRNVDRDPMSLLGHAEELRRRLLVAIGILFIGMLVSFSFRFDHLEIGWLPILVPAVQDNMAAQLFRVLSEHLVPANVTLIVTRPIDGFLAELYMSIGIGAILALPMLLYQIFAFVAPALEQREKRILWGSLGPVVFLFMCGIAFGWVFVLPFLLETLYGYTIALGAEPLLAISELVAFTITMLLVFAVSFQMPLVMYILARTGVASSRGYLHYWRHAVVGLFIFSAFITDPTIISQLMVAVPLIVLYFMGIAASILGERRAKAEV